MGEPSIFDNLPNEGPEIAELGKLAEELIATDLDSSCIKQRLVAELIVKYTYDKYELPIPVSRSFCDLLSADQFVSRVPANIIDCFHRVRRTGNMAAHSSGVYEDKARKSLQVLRAIVSWYARFVLDGTKLEEKPTSIPDPIPALVTGHRQSSASRKVLDRKAIIKAKNAELEKEPEPEPEPEPESISELVISEVVENLIPEVEEAPVPSKCARRNARKRARKKEKKQQLQLEQANNVEPVSSNDVNGSSFDNALSDYRAALKSIAENPLGPKTPLRVEGPRAYVPTHSTCEVKVAKEPSAEIVVEEPIKLVEKLFDTKTDIFSYLNDPEVFKLANLAARAKVAYNHRDEILAEIYSSNSLEKCDLVISQYCERLKYDAAAYTSEYCNTPWKDIEGKLQNKPNRVECKATFKEYCNHDRQLYTTAFNSRAREFADQFDMYAQITASVLSALVVVWFIATIVLCIIYPVYIIGLLIAAVFIAAAAVLFTNNEALKELFNDGLKELKEFQDSQRKG